MDMPIDERKLTFVIAVPSTPRRDFQTGEQRTDKATGRRIWDVELLAGDGKESMPMKVKMFEDVPGEQMTPVTVEDLRFVRVEMRDGGKIEYYLAESIRPIAAGSASAKPAQAAGQAGQTGGQSGGQSAGQASGQAAGKAGA